MLSPPRIVISGIGLVTPVGEDRETSWRALCKGTSATRWLDAESLGLVPGSALASAWEHPWVGAPCRMQTGRAGPGFGREPVIKLALAAADEAFRDARLERDLMDSDRAGCVIGTSKGGFRSFAAGWQSRTRGSESQVAIDVASLWDQFQPDAAARAVAGRFNLRAAALCPVAACATGLVSLARGANLISEGVCDVVMAGSTDASLLVSLLASFGRLGVLARGFDDPASACRPFDARRNGFVVGEGAAVLVLERASHAVERGIVPYAEWLGAALASDPAGLARMEADPRSLARLTSDVLRKAGVAPDEIDYVNMHGTATWLNDRSETRALKQALGGAVRHVSASSLKGTIGHLLGASGSVELAATLLAMRDSIVPPTINLDQPDCECDLDFTPRVARPRRIETALKLSLGFGGHLAAAVVRNWPQPRPRP